MEDYIKALEELKAEVLELKGEMLEQREILNHLVDTLQ
jgi:hypothetical protein